MGGSVLLHRQRSPQDLQQLLAWYKIRDALLGENFFLAVNMIQELFALLVSLAILMIFVKLLILAMRLPKWWWQSELLMRSVFGGRKNLPLKENAMVSTTLDIAIDMD